MTTKLISFSHGVAVLENTKTGHRVRVSNLTDQALTKLLPRAAAEESRRTREGAEGDLFAFTTEVMHR